jgi:putative salt-induced outer membrane protein YdiY
MPPHLLQSRSTSSSSGEQSGWTLRLALLGIATATLLPSTLQGQVNTAEEATWRNAAEITFLMDGGNSEASTLGLRNSLRRTGPNGEFRLDMTALRTDATRISRQAVGTSPDEFQVEELRETERSAERYSVQSRYDRNMTERIFAFGGVGWERNTFAGFNHRTVGVAGAGSQWGEGRDWQLKLGSGLTYTVQRDVTPDPERDDSFAGLRLTMDYAHPLTEGTQLDVRWVVDGNAKEPSDWRGDLVQAVSASLTDRLALKTTLQLRLDNEPPVEALPLMTPGGVPTGQEVLAPLRRVDHSLSVALVITL